MKDIKSDHINEPLAREGPDQKHPAQQQPGDKARKQIFIGIANQDTFDPPRMIPDTDTPIYGANRLAPLQPPAT